MSNSKISGQGTGGRSLSEAISPADWEFDFHTLADSIPQLAWMADTAGNFFWYNQRWYDYTGTVFEEMQGWGWKKVHHPDEVGRVVEGMQRAFATGEPWEDTFPLRSKDGEYRWFLSWALPIRDPEGRVLRWCGTHTDVTEQRQMEQALRENEQRLSVQNARLAEVMSDAREARHRIVEITDNVPCVVFEFEKMQDGSARATFVSGGMQALIGVSAAEVMKDVGRYFATVLPEDVAGYVADIDRSAATVSDHHFTVRIRHAVSGKIRWLQVDAPAPRVDAEGNARWRGYIQDVTDQKVLEEEQRDSQQRYRGLVSATASLVWETTAEGEVEDLPEWRAYTGLSVEEVRGWGWLNALHPEDRARTGEVWRKAIDSIGLYESEYRIRRKDGVYQWHLARGIPILDANGLIRMWVGSCLDIDARRRAEEALHEAKEAADSANQAKSAFLANMSHEIRTPMNAILGFSDLLRQSEMPGRERSYLDAIIASGRSLLTLINDILDLSKVEAGKLELQYEVFSLHALLRETRMIFMQRAMERGIGLDLTIEPGLPEWIFLDEVRLRQILFNLIGNAIKFTHEGAVRIAARGDVDPEQTDRATITLEVHDSGIGIPADQVDRVFESFQQVSGQSTRTYGGTGLGLAISRRLTEMMGGIIGVQSELGRGSTFCVELRGVTLAAPPNEQAVAGTADDLITQLKPTVILYADDEPLNRSLMQGYFNGTEHRLILAADGREAVERVEGEKPELVLMDIRMPVMDGEEATRLIKAKHPDLPVIVVTASSIKDEQRHYEQICDCVLGKPLSRGDLARALKRFLPQKETFAAATDPVVNPADKLATAQWEPQPELVAGLREQLNAIWPRLRETPSMGEAETFARNLALMAERFSAPPLARYAQRLLKQIDEFDVEGLGETLAAFPNILEN